MENIIVAHKILEDIIGEDIPHDILEHILDEVEHIAIHELCHAVIRAVYPEIESLYEKNEELATCIDEITSRLLETYVSRKIGGYVHSIEEHVYELKLYKPLSNLNLSENMLAELYVKAEEALNSKECLCRLLKHVENVCKELIFH